MTGRRFDEVELDLIGKIVAVLEEPAGGLMDDAARRLWRHRMNKQVDALPQDSYAVPHVEFAGVVGACAEQDALEPLIDVIRLVAPLLERHLRPLVDEWQAHQFYRGRDWGPLREALQQPLTEPADLADLFASASGGRRRLPAHCTTPWQAFVNLADLNAPAGGTPPSMLFLERLTRCPELATAAASIRAWNAHFAAAWNLSDPYPSPEAAPLPAPEDPAKPPSAEPRPLIRVYICVTPDRAPQRRRVPRYHVTVAVKYADSPALHREPEPEPQASVTRDRLNVRVAELLSRVAASWHNRSDPVALDFFLPLELLDEPVEWWNRNPARGFDNPLLNAYEVTVHSLERVQRQEFHRAWRERHARWKRQQANGGSGSSHAPGGVHVCVLDPPVADPAHLSRLDAVVGYNDDVVAMMLCEVPWKQDTLGGQEVNLALEYGVFVWIYHRADGSSPAWRVAVREAVNEVGLAGIPQLAHQWKADAAMDRPGTHDPAVIRSLVVLWDDPEQLLDGGPAAPATFVGGTS
ncbi:hypothetical protein BN159_5775 [Streptomyces davaonensis JCM 4913]|uniref:Uncharacterized protein n=1 Tax=Streptomyces davaonensis (strain DSM 101723 / JCM 4913 / KCC S-0913 / 768) TaxID=1214101 RepID=K4RBF2_STRDJ|nr:hypothetical protein [Streptomyces davaonensis]CCK30154.1 hypothetical protein BN159_5775 [Streptomyces davaonensis JCM 4913]